MSGDLIHANPSDVRQLARELERFKDEVKQINRKAEQAINRADWRDGQKEKFAASYKDFQRQSNRFVDSQVSQFVESLNRLAGDLEQAQRHRF